LISLFILLANGLLAAKVAGNELQPFNIGLLALRGEAKTMKMWSPTANYQHYPHPVKCVNS